jgi:hypothetical protein
VHCSSNISARSIYTLIGAQQHESVLDLPKCAHGILSRGTKRRAAMCDYSLESVASRPAAIADKLVTTKFSGAVTLGFASVTDDFTAVCLRPGTELAFDKPPKHSRRFLFGCEKAAGQVARFRQVNVGIAHAHHDALEFADGTVVLVAKLLPGQHATVLQLPVLEQPLKAAAVVSKRTAQTSQTS